MKKSCEDDNWTLECELEASRRVNECLVEEAEEKGHQLEEARANERQLSGEVHHLRDKLDTTFCKIDTAQVLEGPRKHFTESLERGLDTSLIDEEKKRNFMSSKSKLPLTSLARLAVKNPNRVDKNFVEPYVLRYIVPFADSCQDLCEERNDLVHPAPMLVDRRGTAINSLTSFGTLHLVRASTWRRFPSLPKPYGVSFVGKARVQKRKGGTTRQRDLEQC